MRYVALARRDHERAVSAFDAALLAEPQYVPALVGRGQSLLALGRDDEALAAFESALAVDSSLADLRGRVEVLRFRNLQDLIAAARAAAAAGRRAEARAAYTRAVQATPDSAFLHRELGVLERQDGNVEAALGHLRRAAELDPGDAVSLVQIGEMLEERQDYAGAEATYRRAATIEPSADAHRENCRPGGKGPRGEASRRVPCDSHRDRADARRPGGADWRSPRAAAADRSSTAGGLDRHCAVTGRRPGSRRSRRRVSSSRSRITRSSRAPGVRRGDLAAASQPTGGGARGGPSGSPRQNRHPPALYRPRHWTSELPGRLRGRRLRCHPDARRRPLRGRARGHRSRSGGSDRPRPRARRRLTSFDDYVTRDATARSTPNAQTPDARANSQRLGTGQESDWELGVDPCATRRWRTSSRSSGLC